MAAAAASRKIMRPKAPAGSGSPVSKQSREEKRTEERREEKNAAVVLESVRLLFCLSRACLGKPSDLNTAAVSFSSSFSFLFLCSGGPWPPAGVIDAFLLFHFLDNFVVMLAYRGKKTQHASLFNAAV